MIVGSPSRVSSVESLYNANMVSATAEPYRRRSLQSQSSVYAEFRRSYADVDLRGAGGAGVVRGAKYADDEGYAPGFLKHDAEALSEEAIDAMMRRRFPALRMSGDSSAVQPYVVVELPKKFVQRSTADAPGDATGGASSPTVLPSTSPSGSSVTPPAAGRASRPSRMLWDPELTKSALGEITTLMDYRASLRAKKASAFHGQGPLSASQKRKGKRGDNSGSVASTSRSRAGDESSAALAPPKSHDKVTGSASLSGTKLKDSDLVMSGNGRFCMGTLREARSAIALHPSTSHARGTPYEHAEQLEKAHNRAHKSKFRAGDMKPTSTTKARSQLSSSAYLNGLDDDAMAAFKKSVEERKKQHLQKLTGSKKRK